MDDKNNDTFGSAMKQTAEKGKEKFEEEAKKQLIKKIISIIGVKALAITILVVVGGALLAVIIFAGALKIKGSNQYSTATDAATSSFEGGTLNTIIKVEDDGYKITYDDEAGNTFYGEEALEQILIDNGMNMSRFTDDEIECLYNCLKAEWATTYPNLGKDVDNTDSSGEYIQGVITVKRNSEGNVKDISYLEYSDFSAKCAANDTTMLDYFSINPDTGDMVIANWSSNSSSYEFSGDIPTDIAGNCVDVPEEYTITETSIDYKSLIGIHSLPFNFSLALMVNTRSTELVNALAELAFNSTIELTIYDNTTETVSVWNEENEIITKYKKLADSYKKVITAEDGSTTTETVAGPIEIKGEQTESKKYTIQSTTTRKENSYVVGLTNIKSWFADIQNEYVYSTPTTTNENADDYKDESTENFTESLTATETDVVAYKNKVLKSDSKITSCTINNPVKTGTITTNVLATESKTITNYTYQTGTQTVNNIGEDFRKLYNEYPILDANMDSVGSWLYEMLENEEVTTDYVTIMKYLMQVCAGKEYGITDEEIQDLIKYSEVGGFSSISSFNGDCLEEKIWFALKNEGFSDEAVAGVIGNLAYESGGLNLNAVEDNGVGIGLAQWSYGRRTQIESYAQSKGVEWSDESTQIEFLVTEITGKGAAKDYASKQFITKEYNGTSYGEAEWKNATSVEIATVAFCVSWERPADPGYSLYNTPYTSRIDYAEEIYNRLHGKTYGGSESTVGGSGLEYGTFTSTINGKTFTIFLQNNIAKLSGKSGWTGYCNRASSMCIVSAYTNKSTTELINEIDGYSGGIPYGTNGNLYFEKYGLSVSARTTSQNHTSALSAQLRSGGYALVHAKNNFVGKSGTKWAGEMHWLAIIGYKNENGKEKIYISDSRSNNKSGWYDIDEFQSKQSGTLNYLIFINE